MALMSDDGVPAAPRGWGPSAGRVVEPNVRPLRVLPEAPKQDEPTAERYGRGSGRRRGKQRPAVSVVCPVGVLQGAPSPSRRETPVRSPVPGASRGRRRGSSFDSVSTPVEHGYVWFS